MRFTPRLLLVALALMLSQPCLAKKAPIEPSPALKHAESLMADAEKIGAPELVPNLWLGALQKLNAAYDSFHKQVEAGARDEDEPEAIAALRAAEEAEVDAELAQASAQATRDEGRTSSSPRSARSSAPSRPGAYRLPSSQDQSSTEGQP